MIQHVSSGKTLPEKTRSYLWADGMRFGRDMPHAKNVWPGEGMNCRLKIDDLNPPNPPK
jgi:hypothetical protein